MRKILRFRNYKKLIFCLTFLCFVIYSLSFPISILAKNAQESEQKSVPKTPEVEAKSAILMDFKTGRVLWEKNAHEPLSMASTTKIMTAVIALENGNLNDTVTVSALAAAANPVKMYLKAGEEISLEALLYALMLQSSNDAAVAIAEHIGGSVKNFCQMMTDKADELGARDTVFETPNGLDSGDHHSTAYDLAVIARYALNNKKLIEIMNTPNISVKSSKGNYDIINKNRLLHEFNGANGMKTGFTGKAGHCFVGSAQRDGMQLISVVLASGWGQKGRSQKWVDTKRVLNYGFDNYKYEVLLEPGTPAGDVSVNRSKTDKVGTYYSDGLELPVLPGDKEKLVIKTYLLEQVNAPVKPGEILGVAKLYLDGDLYKEVNLLTSESADRFDLKTCMEDVLNCFISMGINGNGGIVLPEIGN